MKKLPPGVRRPLGALDREAAGRSLRGVKRCLCVHSWEARYAEGNVLHDFMLPGPGPVAPSEKGAKDGNAR